MSKILVLLALSLTATFGFTDSFIVNDDACPSVSALQKTGQTSSSMSFSWDTNSQIARYKAWYVRQSDQYTGSAAYTTASSYTFSGLIAGEHTFYFQSECGGEVSGFIGIVDILED